MSQTDESAAVAEIAWPSTFPLRKSVKAYDDEIKALSLREPTGNEVIKHGLLDGLDPERAVALITDLAAVPDSTVRAMDARDLLKLVAIIGRFFGEAARV